MTSEVPRFTCHSIRKTSEESQIWAFDLFYLWSTNVRGTTKYTYEYQYGLSQLRSGLILCNFATRQLVQRTTSNSIREPATFYLGTEDELHVPQHALGGARIRDREFPLESLTSHASPPIRDVFWMCTVFEPCVFGPSI